MLSPLIRGIPILLLFLIFPFKTFAALNIIEVAPLPENEVLTDTSLSPYKFYLKNNGGNAENNIKLDINVTGDIKTISLSCYDENDSTIIACTNENNDDNWDCSKTGTTVSCDLDSIAANSSSPKITLNGTSNPTITTGKIGVQVCVDNNCQNTQEIVVNAETDLSIEQNTSASAVMRGNEFDYTIRVQNRGDNIARNVQVTGNLHNNGTYKNITVSNEWECSTGLSSFTCWLGAEDRSLCNGTQTKCDLNSKDAAPSIIITAEAPANAVELNNIVTVSSDTADNTPSNNNTSNVASGPLVFSYADIPPSGEAPLTVNLPVTMPSQISDSSDYSYYWSSNNGLCVSPINLGDGCDQSNSPSLTFDKPDTYELSLTIVKDGSPIITNDRVSLDVLGKDTPIARLNILPEDRTALYPGDVITLDPGESDPPANHTIIGYRYTCAQENIVIPHPSTGDDWVNSATTQRMTLSEEGTHSIVLTVLASNGTEHSTEVSINVGESTKPVASFEYTPTQGFAPLPVTLDASSSTDLLDSNHNPGQIREYLWTITYPDGNQEARHQEIESVTLSNPGIHTFALTVVDSDNFTAGPTTQTFRVGGTRQPVAIMSVEPVRDYIIKDDDDTVSVDFSAVGSYDPDGLPITYLWTLSDGRTHTEESGTFEFNKGQMGYHTLTLTVTDEDGHHTSDTRTIEILSLLPNTPPVARIYANPIQGRLKETGNSKLFSVDLDASGSFDEDTDDSLTYRWSSTTAQQPEIYAEQATMRFDSIGDHIISLAVSDGTHTSTEQVTVTVLDSLPEQVDFSYTPRKTNYCMVDGASLPISLETQVYDQVDYTWTANEEEIGVPANSNTTTMVFTEFGQYLLKLSISDGNQTRVSEKRITIRECPKAQFTLSELSGNAPLNITVNAAQSLGDIQQYEWFIDSERQECTQEQCRFTLEESKVYDIELGVSNGFRSDFQTQSVAVSQPIPVDGQMKLSSVYDLAPLSLTAQVINESGPIESYQWSGIGTTEQCDEKICAFTLEQAGEYVLTTTLTGSSGQQKTLVSQTITVLDPEQQKVSADLQVLLTFQNGIPTKLQTDARNSKGPVNQYTWFLNNVEQTKCLASYCEFDLQGYIDFVDVKVRVSNTSQTAIYSDEAIEGISLATKPVELPEPKVNAFIKPTAGEIGKGERFSVTADARESEGILRYKWRASTSIENTQVCETPYCTHIFEEVGEHPIVLEAFGENGTVETSFSVFLAEKEENNPTGNGSLKVTAKFNPNSNTIQASATPLSGNYTWTWTLVDSQGKQQEKGHSSDNDDVCLSNSCEFFNIYSNGTYTVQASISNTETGQEYEDVVDTVTVKISQETMTFEVKPSIFNVSQESDDLEVTLTFDTKIFEEAFSESVSQCLWEVHEGSENDKEPASVIQEQITDTDCTQKIKFNKDHLLSEQGTSIYTIELTIKGKAFGDTSIARSEPAQPELLFFQELTVRHADEAASPSLIPEIPSTGIIAQLNEPSISTMLAIKGDAYTWSVNAAEDSDEVCKEEIINRDSFLNAGKTSTIQFTKMPGSEISCSYDVTVTVTDKYGVAASDTKENAIVIAADPCPSVNISLQDQPEETDKLEEVYPGQNFVAEAHIANIDKHNIIDFKWLLQNDVISRKYTNRCLDNGDADLTKECEIYTSRIEDLTDENLSERVSPGLYKLFAQMTVSNNIPTCPSTISSNEIAVDIKPYQIFRFSTLNEESKLGGGIDEETGFPKPTSTILSNEDREIKFILDVYFNNDDNKPDCDQFDVWILLTPGNNSVKASSSFYTELKEVCPFTPFPILSLGESGEFSCLEYGSAYKPSHDAIVPLSLFGGGLTINVDEEILPGITLSSLGDYWITAFLTKSIDADGHSPDLIRAYNQNDDIIDLFCGIGDDLGEVIKPPLLKAFSIDK